MSDILPVVVVLVVVAFLFLFNPPHFVSFILFHFSFSSITRILIQTRPILIAHSDPCLYIGQSLCKSGLIPTRYLLQLPTCS